MKPQKISRWLVLPLLLLTLLVSSGFGPHSYRFKAQTEQITAPNTPATQAQPSAPASAAQPQAAPAKPAQTLTQSVVQWLAEGMQALGEFVLGAFTALVQGVARWVVELIAKRTGL